MSFTPTIVFAWQDNDGARVVFVPALVYESLAVKSQQSHQSLKSQQSLQSLDGNAFPAVRTFQDFVNVFEESDEEDDNNVERVIEELSKLPGCVEDYVQFVYGARVFPDIPKGMAIVQWYFRTSDE